MSATASGATRVGGGILSNKQMALPLRKRNFTQPRDTRRGGASLKPACLYLVFTSHRVHGGTNSILLTRVLASAHATRLSLRARDYHVVRACAAPAAGCKNAARLTPREFAGDAKRCANKGQCEARV